MDYINDIQYSGVNVNALIEYLLSVCPPPLGSSREKCLEKFREPGTGALLKRFIGDAQVGCLQVYRSDASKDNDKETESSINLELEVTYRKGSAAVLVVKRVNFDEDASPMTSQHVAMLTP